jgi:hypothetical protein
MIAWPPGACGDVALKPKRRQIELINKQIDNGRKVIFPDPVVQPHWEKRRLISADTLDETRHAKPP